MIYLLTCKHEEEQTDRGWLIHVSFDVICVCVVILHLKRHACVIISVQYNFLYDLSTHLQSLKKKATGAG
jgi:protein tyrosine phosphatase